MARTLFISDLHLSAERAAANEALFAFLEERVPGSNALYILGDLFEYWIGDDDLSDPFHAIVAGFFARTVQAGTPMYLMHGNRDFLIGDAFCAAAQVTRLEDPTVLNLFGTPTLLMHGDTLCTDDTSYMDWRRTCRAPAWQQEFLSQPLAARRAQMLQWRAQSEAGKQSKSAQVMDVNATAVIDALNAHQCRRLIHGHTHRPGRHALEINHQTAERIVLADWYTQGSFLEVTAQGCRQHTLAFI